MEEKSQAISFANSYFSLVDGLAPGLEYHLAKDVILDWFGRTIRGRDNVTEFIKSNKIGSRHVFKNIAPVPSINYRKSQTDRKISSLMSEGLNFAKLSISDPENNNVRSSDTAVINSRDVICTAGSCEPLENVDLANLSALNIGGEDTDENNQQQPSGDNSKRFFASENNNRGTESEGPRQAPAMKYVEANGQIEFSKKSIKRGTELQTWKRQSKLLIAYSPTTNDDLYGDYEEDEKYEDEEEEEEVEEFYGETEANDPSVVQVSKTGTVSSCKVAVGRLPSLDEITDIGSNLVPNLNNFGGYFPTFDFLAERDNFLTNFNAELQQLAGLNNNSTSTSTSSLHRTPLRYVENRLVFPEINERLKSRPRRNYDAGDANEYDGNRFVFNYVIHLIVYQGNSKCRRSLSREFESSHKSNKRFLAAGVE